MIFNTRQSVVFEGCKSCYVFFWGEKLECFTWNLGVFLAGSRKGSATFVHMYVCSKFISCIHVGSFLHAIFCLPMFHHGWVLGSHMLNKDLCEKLLQD